MHLKITFFFFLNSISVFCQLDTPVNLNTTKQLSAVNEEVSEQNKCSFTSKATEGITLFVDTNSSEIIEFRSEIYPKIYEININSNGIPDTTALVGFRNIRSYIATATTTGKNPIPFTIEDRRIVAIQEALDRDGNWIPIEYFEHSSCGVSYMKRCLEPNRAYSFRIAKYEGEFETKLRLKVLFGEEVIYSNEFRGSINHTQFEDTLISENKEHF